MSYYLLVTESGSQHQLDTEKKTMQRVAGLGAETLDYDDKPIPYHELLSDLTIDTPLRVLWKDGERWRVRSTTNIVMIEKG